MQGRTAHHPITSSASQLYNQLIRGVGVGGGGVGGCETAPRLINPCAAILGLMGGNEVVVLSSEKGGNEGREVSVLPGKGKRACWSDHDKAFVVTCIFNFTTKGSCKMILTLPNFNSNPILTKKLLCTKQYIKQIQNTCMY